MKTIGLIEAGGTGKELAAIFKEAVIALCKKEEQEIPTFVSFKEKYGYNPSTFWGIRDSFSKSSYSKLLKSIKEEEKDLNSFLALVSKKKGLGVFRTAINAETLYQLRIAAKIVKAVEMQVRERRLLFVRDQIQGFYANNNVKSDPKQLQVKSSFSRTNFNSLIAFIKGQLKYRKKPDLILFIYKYHIFGLELEKMIVSEYTNQKIDIPYKIMQPDSGLHFLLHDWWKSDKKDVLVVCGNEVGDVLLESMIHFYSLGTKESVFTNEFALAYKNLEILQTMHGSADSLAGKDSVNPTATLKAVAYALENWLNIPNARIRMDKAIKSAIKKKYVTEDIGGNKGTRQMLEYVLKAW